uniref:NB-ARC domain-containing protein n=1 Tax=Arundo donax TaxID=35708 RepID=A0A0A9AFA0_ARUDO
MDTSVGVRSLSLDLGNSSWNVLRFLENSYGYLSSLKLHGALSGLTQFATSLCGLTELCLSSTNNLTSNELSNLRKLIHLEYLKLVKASLGSFVIRRRDFPRLLRLCLVQSSTLPTIEEGALPKLVSLQLLCEDLVGLSGIKIEGHKHLQEVALDSMVNSETITIWENAAKKHPKRPRVLFLQRVGSDMLKYVATERPSPETESFIVRGKREIHEVQSSLVIDLDSALKRMKFSGSSLASTELPSARNDVMPSPSRAVS